MAYISLSRVRVVLKLLKYLSGAYKLSIGMHSLPRHVIKYARKNVEWGNWGKFFTVLQRIKRWAMSRLSEQEGVGDGNGCVSLKTFISSIMLLYALESFYEFLCIVKNEKRTSWLFQIDWRSLRFYLCQSFLIEEWESFSSFYRVLCRSYEIPKKFLHNEPRIIVGNSSWKNGVVCKMNTFWIDH